MMTSSAETCSPAWETCERWQWCIQATWSNNKRVLLLKRMQRFCNIRGRVRKYPQYIYFFNFVVLSDLLLVHIFRSSIRACFKCLKRVVCAWTSDFTASGKLFNKTSHSDRGAVVSQSVYCLTTCWTTGFRFPAEAKDFSCSLCPDQFWGPLSLLSSGYRGWNAAGAWRWPLTPF
jgi:hypothetical protein